MGNNIKPHDVIRFRCDCGRKKAYRIIDLPVVMFCLHCGTSFDRDKMIVRHNERGGFKC